MLPSCHLPVTGLSPCNLQMCPAATDRCQTIAQSPFHFYFFWKLRFSENHRVLCKNASAASQLKTQRSHLQNSLKNVHLVSPHVALWDMWPKSYIWHQFKNRPFIDGAPNNSVWLIVQNHERFSFPVFIVVVVLLYLHSFYLKKTSNLEFAKKLHLKTNCFFQFLLCPLASHITLPHITDLLMCFWELFIFVPQNFVGVCLCTCLCKRMHTWRAA